MSKLFDGELGEFKTFALVDTNNKEELPEDAEGAALFHLHSIVDHHKLVGNLETAAAIEIDIRPLASAGGILYQRLKAAGRPIAGKDCPLNIAGLMLSTILSDTLVLRSGTTTQADRDAVQVLAPMAGIENYTAFGEEILTAKSDISGYTAGDIVLIDSKKYDLEDNAGGTFQVRVAVFESFAPQSLLEMAEDISRASDLQLLADQEEDKSARAVLFFVIDVLEERAIFIPDSSNYTTNLVLNAQFPSLQVLDNGQIQLDGILSRKKQIMPMITSSALVTPYNEDAPTYVQELEYLSGEDQEDDPTPALSRKGSVRGRNFWDF